ncbi:MAG: helix-turn-helix domain-containing protein [Myxococcaceae bacterium]
MNVREVAERLGVSRSTIYAFCAEGRLPHLRVSNALRISVEAVEHFIHPDRKPSR